MLRSGLIAVKLGMSCVFDENGERTPVTLLKVPQCTVIGNKTKERDGYSAVLLGAVDVDPAKVKKSSLRKFFAKVGVNPKLVLKEFRLSENPCFDVGFNLGVVHFHRGQLLDVTGVSTGKGFAGVMKRYNFRGLEASHGVSVSHRSHGSTGGRQDPGKVFKNKKMAGHMGCKQVTQHNLFLYDVDVEDSLLVIKGAIPGVSGGIVYVRDAVKMKMFG